MSNLYAVIMAGGKGERLWPLSTPSLPKPFIKIAGKRSLLEELLRALKEFIPLKRTLIVAPKCYFHVIRSHMPEFPIENIIIEPVGKNTAACIALASFYLEKRDPKACFMALPADHYIPQKKAFAASLKLGSKMLSTHNGSIVIGIKATRPETGYGYIERGSLVKKGFWKIKRFCEKPNLQQAMAFLKKRTYYWNSGIFIWNNANFQELLAKHLPGHAKAFSSLKKLKEGPALDKKLKKEYSKIKPISIDYGIMEKADNTAMVEGNFLWDDLGSWSAMERTLQRKNGNFSWGNVMNLDSKGCVIYSSEGSVATMGLRDMVVANHKGNIAVFPKHLSASVRSISKAIEKHNGANKISAQASSIGERPWGKWTVLDEGKGYKVKRIEIFPGKRLSLQKHKLRSEHWNIIFGEVLVTCGSKNFTVKTNQSTFIPKGTVHRLANNSRAPAALIEVQIGNYLGEDDIVRLKDDYGRD
ncbi:mannose-1-phosphate guanylyltransferase/mannose-6-phosphate isomerase [Elusimicrobiota bacterium]